MRHIMIFMCMLANAVTHLVAQNVKGKVVDKNQQPIEAATVVLQMPDSAFINATITDSLGRFSFEERPESYRLIFQHLLFKTLEREESRLDVGTVTLESQDYALDEVVVRGERPQIKVEKGALVYDANLLAERTTASNAYESILRLPGVREQDGTILLTGAKDVNIVINGKPSSMNREQLAELLRSTSVSNIQNIEVMYNAPAKYRVRGAVINVVLKRTKSTDPLLRGEVSGHFKRSAYTGGGGNLSLSYAGKKLSADLSYSPRYSHSEVNMEMLSLHTLNGETHAIDQVNEGDMKAMNQNLRFGMDYSIAEGHDLNVAYTASFKRNGKASQRSTGNFSDSDNKKASEERMHNLHIDYTSSFGLNVGLDYTHYKSPSTQDFTDRSETEERRFQVEEWQSIDRWNLYAGQTHALSNHWSLNYGVNFSFANEKSGQFYLPQDGSDLSGLNTDMRMREETYNFYAGAEKAFGERLSLSFSVAGERYKLADYKRWAVYPTLQLSYQAGPSHIFQLGFSSDKEYPDYWTLQNTVNYLNGYTKILGNPNIVPSTDYTAQLTYIFQGKYVANLYFSHIKDYIMQLPYQSPDELSLIYQFINYDYERNVGLTLMIPFSIASVWNTQLTLDGSFNKDVCDSYHAIDFHRTNVQGIAQWNNTFRLSRKPDIRLELNALYASPTLQGIYDLSAIYKIDAGLKWTFANECAELRVQGNDLFNSATPNGRIDYKGQRLDLRQNQMARSLIVTFTYKFNGYTRKPHKEVDTSRFGY